MSYIKKPYISLREAANGRWYFFRVAKNGKKTETSQTYAHKRTAKAAAKRDIPGLQIHEERND